MSWSGDLGAAIWELGLGLDRVFQDGRVEAEGERVCATWDSLTEGFHNSWSGCSKAVTMFLVLSVALCALGCDQDRKVGLRGSHGVQICPFLQERY